jgi:hypothetical protein
MKKLVSFGFASLLIASAFVSCKKGEHDPFLSLKSRTARVSADWTVSSEDVTMNEHYTPIVDSIPMDSTISTTSIYDGTKLITTTVTTIPDTVITHKDTLFYTHKINIKKDGTYSQTIKFKNNLDIMTTEGTWVFLGKSKINDLKKKEAILLTTTKTIISDGNVTNVVDYVNLDGRTLVIDQLKSGEMITIVSDDEKNEDGKTTRTKSTKTIFTSNE